MRNSEFYVVRADVSVNDFICRRRFICFYKSVQRFCCGISRFHFHWNHFSVFFYQKFQFVGIVRLVIIKRVTVFHQRFGDNIFVNTAFGIPLYRVFKNRSFGFKTIHSAQQARIVDIQFELIFVGVRHQRQIRLVNIVTRINDIRVFQPLNASAVFFACLPFFHGGILKFRNLLCELLRNSVVTLAHLYFLRTLCVF